MLAGRKKEFRRKELVDYFGRERLGLTKEAVEDILDVFNKVRSNWEQLIDISFLSPVMKQAYLDLLANRFSRLNIL